MRRLAAPGATREDWVFDAILAGLAVVLVEVPYVFLASLFGQIRDPRLLAAAGITGLVMLVPIALRRHYPLPMTALVAVGALAQVVTVPVPTAAIVVVPLCAYTVARLVEGPVARSVVLLGALGAVLGPVRWIVGPFGRTPAAVLAAMLTGLVCLGLVVTPYAIGRRARDAAAARQAHLDAQAERYRILLSEREQRARAAEEAVRNRIARELHDVVAHSISVMVVQADGGRATAAKNPQAAAEVLGTIAETGREALAEMRRLVGVLRDSDDQDLYTPSPTLAEIPEMTARAGARLDVAGSAPDLPATVQLTAYRIVQEALTNTLKHAGAGAEPRVRLTFEADSLGIEVSDSGAGPIGDDDGEGNGLRGMRERVAALGGTLEAGAGAAAGFVVRAKLPLGGDAGESDP